MTTRRGFIAGMIGAASGIALVAASGRSVQTVPEGPRVKLRNVFVDDVRDVSKFYERDGEQVLVKWIAHNRSRPRKVLGAG